MCVNIMYMENEIYLTGIGLPIRFRSCVMLVSERADNIYKGIDKFFRTYNKNSYRVKKLLYDGQLKLFFEKVKDNLRVEMNYTNAQDHVPEAERNNRTIKDAVRTAFH